MGMFTSIIHPKDGRELQIKCGYDDCETYKVGDTVEFHINQDWPGHGKLFDGVYDSNSNKGQDDWVIIKDHKVLAVVSRKRYKTSGELEAIYDIEEYQREWWPESKWVEQELLDAVSALKNLEDKIVFLKRCEGKTDKEIKELYFAHIGELGAEMLKQQLNKYSSLREILVEKPIEKE